MLQLLGKISDALLQLLAWKYTCIFTDSRTFLGYRWMVQFYVNADVHSSKYNKGAKLKVVAKIDKYTEKCI